MKLPIKPLNFFCSQVLLKKFKLTTFQKQNLVSQIGNFGISRFELIG